MALIYARNSPGRHYCRAETVLRPPGIFRDAPFYALSVLLPVVPDVLHVLVILQHVDELVHALDVVLAGHGDVILRHHLDLGAFEGIALVLQGLHHVVEAVGIGGDLEHGAVRGRNPRHRRPARPS